MNNNVKITVIVLGDCERERLFKCLEKITSQTHSMFECLVVIKEEGEVKKQEIEQYNDGRMMPIVCNTQATTANDMFAVGFSWKCDTSQYCVCVDAEDSIEVDYLNTMLKAIIRDGTDVVCGTTILDEDCLAFYAEDMVWNKIYKREIDWNNAKISFTTEATYHRQGKVEGTNYVKRKFDARLDDIKMAVLDECHEYISFDIFDTLIVRPFMNPQDLFLLLDEEFEKNIKCNKNFASMRISAETIVRKQANEKHIEDISIDEIYTGIYSMYGIDQKILESVKEYEKELEVSFSRPRRTVQDIYQLALDAGKKIILISDMYLDQNIIEKILKNNGYTGYTKVFLSSTYRKLKGTGNLYEEVIEDLKVSPAKILHIGDDYFKDVQMAQKKGINACHIPKTMDIFSNIDYCKGTDTCISMTQKICGKLISYDKIEKSVGYRCMLAMCANKYFDNPFKPFDRQSVLNADPYFIGYYLIGMYLLGINLWIEEIVENGSYDKVYFTSRDGWMPMLAYNILRQKNPQLPQSEYFYTSRKAVLPAMLKEELDFYELPIDVKRYTPRKFFQLLSFCTKRSEKAWIEVCDRIGILPDVVFQDEVQVQELTKIFIHDFYDKEEHNAVIEKIRKYYKKLNRKSIMFDMGYSGRIQNAISYLAGEGIDVMFIHSDVDKHDILSRKAKFRIYSFFNFIPQMSDAVREYMLSSCKETCIGYEEVNGKILPVFEKSNNIRNLKTILEMQKGAEEFVQEFYDTFGTFKEYISYKSTEVALPLEGFLRCSTEADREVFAEVLFDDAVYGGDDMINLKGMMELERAWLPEE